MLINITTLEDYCKRNGFFISTSIDFDAKPKTFVFTQLDKQLDPPTADLTIRDIDELLLLNKITGAGGKLEAATAVTPREYANRPSGSRVKQRELEKLVYDTIAKYIGLLLGIMPVSGHDALEVKLLSQHRRTHRRVYQR